MPFSATSSTLVGVGGLEVEQRLLLFLVVLEHALAVQLPVGTGEGIGAGESRSVEMSPTPATKVPTSISSSMSGSSVKNSAFA